MIIVFSPLMVKLFSTSAISNSQILISVTMKVQYLHLYYLNRNRTKLFLLENSFLSVRSFLIRSHSGDSLGAFL